MSMPPRARLSVIVATYEWPDALDLVLMALAEQSELGFEIVVADDGSQPETHRVVERWQAVLDDRLIHSWQVDDGYRRARSLNLAALHATSGFLVFIDGDCLPRRRFVEAVRRAALPGWFLASKRVNLSAGLTRRVLEERLPIWRWSAVQWLAREPGELFHSQREVARPGLLVPLRDRRRPWRPRQPEFAPPYDGYGFCLGVARDDLERVNGFDMRFTGWGGEDVDVATRLRQVGLRCGWPGAHATMLHLWHMERKGAMSSNAALVDETSSSGRIEAVAGLRELARELEADTSHAGSV